MAIIPPCAVDDSKVGFARRLYAAYNRGGNPERMGLNYQDKPCPSWPDLPQDVRDKWQAVADFALSRLVLWR